jgi:hypothetical protein
MPARRRRQRRIREKEAYRLGGAGRKECVDEFDSGEGGRGGLGRAEPGSLRNPQIWNKYSCCFMSAQPQIDHTVGDKRRENDDCNLRQQLLYRKGSEGTMSQDGSDHQATERGFSETCCINWLELNSIRQRRKKICSGVRNAAFFTEQCLYGYSGSLNLQQPKKPSNE